MAKVAVVTGANKGIGYAIVKGLAKEIDGIVYLTARNDQLGQDAVGNLKKELGSPVGDKIRFHQLDVTKVDSITSFRDHLKKEHGGIDILVNNAGVAPHLAPGNEDMPLEKQIEFTLAANYFGVKNVSHELFPLLRPHARIVAVASRAGALRCLENPDLQSKFLDENLTEEQIEAILDDYIHACCPGLVATDMAASVLVKLGNLKPGDQLTPEIPVKTIDEGADTMIYLALLPPHTEEPKGQFVAERKVLDWANLPTNKEIEKSLFQQAQADNPVE